MPDPNLTWRAPTAATNGPDRYRALYAYSALNLNYSTALWSVTRYLCNPANDVVRSEAEQSLEGNQLGDLQPGHLDGVAALRQALHGARELFVTSHDEIVNPSFFRKRKVHRYPRYFLTKRTVDALASRDLTPFLTREIRPSAMSLIAGALQLRDQALGAPMRDKQGVPDDGSPEALVTSMSTKIGPDRRAIVKWLETQGVPYRLEYNLACYFSRELADVDPEHRSRTAEIAWKHLECSLRKCPSEERVSIRRMALHDPALIPLRLEYPDRFQRLSTTTTKAPASVEDAPAEEPPTAVGNPVPDAPTPGVDLSADGKIPAQLVPDDHLRGMLDDLLVPLRRLDTRTIARSDLLEPQENGRVQVVERTLAADSSPEDAAVLRELLARLLFLPSWPGEQANGAGTQDPGQA